MSEINYNIGLCGEFRLTVLDNKTVISDTGWCKNTILSGGLVYLASNSFLQSLNYIDFGTDSSNPGDFTLTGVISPCLNTELFNISSNNIQYYTINKSTQVFYSTYSSPLITSRDETISEFCVRAIDRTEFSRAILPEPVAVSVGQNVNFEYRVSVDYSNEHVSNVEFVTYDGSSFFIPVTSKVFNLPNYDNDSTNTGKLIDDYPMVLLQNSDTVPSFGENYPDEEIYAINNSQQQSTFSSGIVYSDIDYNSKSYSVITEYTNLSAPLNSGIFENINTALLKHNNKGILLSKFEYPLALYNTSLYFNPSVINSSNLISLYYKYTWSETLTSTFQTPTTFTLSAPQLIPCNINLYVDLFPDSFLTINSFELTAPNAPGNISIIRVNLLSSYIYNINVDYSSPVIEASLYQYGPSPYKIIVFDNNNDPISNTGYVFPNISENWTYTTAPLGSLNYYNNKLRGLSNETVNGSTPGTTLLTNISVGNDKSYIDVLVNSPFVGTSWAITLNATATPIPIPLPPLDCFTIYNFIDNVGVYDYTYQLEPTGGIIILDFTSDNVENIPNKLEIIHNNNKVSTTGISSTNTGPYDNVYGTNLTPTLAQALSTDQFISSAKSPPSRYNEFINETSIGDITPTGQQLLWWQYTPEDYANSSTITARFTSPNTVIYSTNEFRVRRLCTQQVPVSAPSTYIQLISSINNVVSVNDGATTTYNAIGTTTNIISSITFSESGQLVSTVASVTNTISDIINIQNGTISSDQKILINNKIDNLANVAGINFNSINLIVLDEDINTISTTQDIIYRSKLIRLDGVINNLINSEQGTLNISQLIEIQDLIENLNLLDTGFFSP